MEDTSEATVLVVEDNIAMNTAICDILELHDFQVLSAQNGRDALGLLRNRRPDVILCDIMMPEMDGFTFLRHTRANERLRTIPFIFLTARSTTEDRRLAKSIGIDDYLVKPVDPEDLLLAVENALRRAHDARAETQQQLDHLREQIVSTLQHEFRTPLTFILGYAEHLAETPPEEVDVESLRTSTSAILEGGRRLSSLVEKFLTLADIQSRSKLPESVTCIRAHSLLKEVQTGYAEQAGAVALSLQLSERNADAAVWGEEQYLYRAVRCLVENAIQYRRPDSRRVWLSVEAVDGYIGLRVADEGPGIPADFLHNLRHPFEQAARDNRTTPGAGLSLALVHHIVRLHGGRLQIESEEGRGSTFTIWLPAPPQLP